MKTLALQGTNRFYLEDANAAVADLTVTASIYGEDGAVALDDQSEEIKDKEATFDDAEDKNQYYIDVIFSQNTRPGYYRIYWNVQNEEINVLIDQSNVPQDIRLITVGDTNGVRAEIMPVSIFLSQYIAADAKLDDDYKDAVESYVKEDRDSMRNTLLASQGELENRIKMKFFKSKDSIKRDYYLQDFKTEFWLQQVDCRPLISVDSFKLVYGSQQAELIPNIADQLVIDKKMGIIEFLPTAMSGSLYSILIGAMNGLGLTIMQGGIYSRVPQLFRIEYTHGLDFPTLDDAKKEAIRRAIGRNALIEILPKIDAKVRLISQSLSMDGVSSSESSGIDRLLKDLREDETKWTEEMKREYGIGYEITVV